MGQSSSTPAASPVIDLESRRTDARRLREQADTHYAATIKAWKAGDRSSAAQHKARRLQLQRNADDLDKEAAKMAFRYYNARYDGQQGEWGTIDLHGLYAAEALERVEAHLAEGKKRARKMGMEKGSIRVITGRGNRSKEGVAVIKPRVAEWCRKRGLKVEQPKNEGLLIVHFDVSERVDFSEGVFERQRSRLWLWLVLGGGLVYWLGKRKFWH